MTINFRPATPEEEVSLEKPESGQDLRGVTMVASCDADHCTVEERAVVDAALACRWALCDASIKNFCDEFPALKLALDALLASRTGKTNST